MKGRVLGIDYGDKRIGLALTDPMRIIASPFRVIHRTELEADLDVLAEIIREEDVVELVMGEPRNTDGTVGPMVERVRRFAAKLVERCPLPLHWVDETYTSLEADQLLRQAHKDWRKRKAKIDMVAAQVILRSFLENS
ncbi:MAG TPA: Holliday junction resolvase RuvX [Planctomycetes bacterium]|nr:Holliday junction resolvase RuvX [Planctomycetota bacterium]